MNHASTISKPTPDRRDHSTADATPWVKRIACISTTRADAGIYRALLSELSAANQFDVSLLAGGTHHSADYGNTAEHLEAINGVRTIAVHHQSEGDGPAQVSETAGHAMTAFSQALSNQPADLVFVLGDRTEMLAAALAATIHRIPLAHLHGGDLTQGAYDDACRHAITKLAHVHFPALPGHAERIRQMGEEPWRIHTVGSLALDSLARFKPEPGNSLRALTGVDFSKPTAVVVYHPETLSDISPARQIDQLLDALKSLPMNLLFIGPNADVGRDAIDSAIARFVETRPDSTIVKSLGQEQFWSCLAHARVLVGNSSSGIIEAASLRLPVVNVGERQRGRLAPGNVIHARIDRDEIRTAVERAASPTFRESLDDLVNPYGDGRTAARIVEAIRALPPQSKLLKKEWAPAT